jgi:hypothetical protein
VAAATQAELVSKLKDLVRRGVPCLVSMPAAWNTPESNPRHPVGVTHVGVAATLTPDGALRVMNPWGGFWQDGDDAYWAARLCYGVIWALEPGSEMALQARPAEIKAAPTRMLQ